MRRQLLSLTIDLLSISLATLLALALRDNFELRGDRILALLPYLGWTLIAAAAVLPMSGTTRPIWRFSSMSDYARIVPAVISIVLAAMASGFVFNRLDHVSRVLPLTQGVFMIFLLVGSRVAFRLYHSYRRSGPKLLAAIKAADVEMVLLVGVNRITELYLVSIDDFAADRIRVVGVLGKSDRHTGRLIQSVPVLGIPEDANIVLNELAVRGIAVNRIVVTMAFDRLTADAQQVLLDIERNSDIKLDLFGERLLLDERQSLRAAREDAGDERHHDTASFVIGEETLQELSRQHYWRWKRAMDVVFAAVLLVACAPLFLFVGLLVAYDVGWPVTFWQQRPGLGGYNFKLSKFRTMGTAYDNSGQRIPDALRLSAIGRFLRKTRLDELPQLLHILKGEMSFVGPRPLLPVDQSPAYAARLMVRPGMTGWAQVKGGRDISAADKAALDVWYVKNASFRLDLEILWKTIPMIVLGERVDREAIRAAWRDLVAYGICAASSLPQEQHDLVGMARCADARHG